MAHSRRLPAIGAIVSAAVLWGTIGTVQTLLPHGRDPLAVGAFRLLFGAAALLAMALATPESRRAAGRLPWGGVLLAGAAIAFYNLLFFRAVTEAGVGIGTAVSIGSAPLWATAYEIVVRGQRPGRLRVLGQVVSVLGVGLLALAGVDRPGSLTGIGLAASAGACYATYALVTGRVGNRAPSVAIAAATFSVAALIALPALFILPLGWVSGPRAWFWIVFLGIGATGIPYALYTWGLTGVTASTAVTLSLAEPVTAWLLASAVVGEPVTAQKVTGALLVLAGLAVITIIPARTASPAELPGRIDGTRHRP